MVKKVRQPATAGQFFPADARHLRAMVGSFMEQTAVLGKGGENGAVPRAIIAPHAGYPYSGPIAESAYAHVVAGRQQIKRVVLVGPAHRVPVRGLAASSADAFATPLGEVPLDREVVEELTALSQVAISDEAHAPEHSLEVHLPFLQVVLEEFLLVPLVVGHASAEVVADALAPFAGDTKTLIAVSSDLSHYQKYERARILDRQASEAIESLRPLTAAQACGWQAINGLLCLARERGWRARTVDLRNSGDTAGSRHQVVGYGAYLLEGNEND